MIIKASYEIVVAFLLTECSSRCLANWSYTTIDLELERMWEAMEDIPLFYRWRNWGTDGLNDLPRVTNPPHHYTMPLSVVINFPSCSSVSPFWSAVYSQDKIIWVPPSIAFYPKARYSVLKLSGLRTSLWYHIIFTYLNLVQPFSSTDKTPF